MTQPDWDDERLKAAFRARFDRPAPTTLEGDIHVRIAGTSPARFGAFRRVGPGWGLVAAAVTVVLVGTVSVGLSGFGRQGGSPPPSDSGPVATPPPPSQGPASTGPWPPEGARVIALTSEVAEGAPPVRVAVVDESGRLYGVAEKGKVDPSTRTLDQPIEAYAELEVSPGRIHLIWIGRICDSQTTVTIAADIRTITFDMGPQVECDSMGIERQLVLDFSGLLEVPSIELVRAAPGAAATGYTLDCGPLRHDCAARVANILAATPERRVVSLRFVDECGSYVATFGDGLGNVAANIDCFLPPDPS